MTTLTPRSGAISETQDHKNKPAYSLRIKGKAFVRGFFGFGPLIEIAREGLRGDYALSKKEKEAYARRLSKYVDSWQGLCRLLGSACPEKTQEALAARFVEYFQNARTDLYLRLRLPPGHYGNSNRECLELAEELADMQAAVCNLFLHGGISSEKAQRILVAVFAYDESMDLQLHHHSKREEHLSALLGSKCLSPGVRTLISNTPNFTCHRAASNSAH